MDQVPVAIAPSIERFVAALRRQRRLKAVYLYRSYASGKAGEWSDIDVAVVSPDFSKDRFQEQVKLLRLAARIDDRIEPRPFRPEDFSEIDPLSSEIRRHGIRLL
jgi:predicted nucleotidyltransferase